MSSSMRAYLLQLSFHFRNWTSSTCSFLTIVTCMSFTPLLGCGDLGRLCSVPVNDPDVSCLSAREPHLKSCLRVDVIPPLWGTDIDLSDQGMARVQLVRKGCHPTPGSVLESLVVGFGSRKIELCLELMAQFVCLVRQAFSLLELLLELGNHINGGGVRGWHCNALVVMVHVPATTVSEPVTRAIARTDSCSLAQRFTAIAAVIRRVSVQPMRFAPLVSAALVSSVGDVRPDVEVNSGNVLCYAQRVAADTTVVRVMATAERWRHKASCLVVPEALPVSEVRVPNGYVSLRRVFQRVLAVNAGRIVARQRCRSAIRLSRLPSRPCFET